MFLRQGAKFNQRTRNVAKRGFKQHKICLAKNNDISKMTELALRDKSARRQNNVDIMRLSSVNYGVRDMMYSNRNRRTFVQKRYFFSQGGFRESEGKDETFEKEIPKSVGVWLLIVAGAVFCIIVVGGLTRLTESGLSMTEWHPVTGILPPIGQEAWEEEFERYKQYPEYNKYLFF